MKPDFRLRSLVAASCFAAMLSGCGGGGDGDNPSPMVRPDAPEAPEDGGMHDLGSWNTLSSGSTFGFENEAMGMRVTSNGRDPRISVDTPAAPTGTGTWRGGWRYHQPAFTIQGQRVPANSATGDASLVVLLGSDGMTATVTLEDYSDEDFVSPPAPIDSNGRFTFGSSDYVQGIGNVRWSAVGQFGGPDGAGVVGYGESDDPRLPFSTIVYGTKEQ